MPRPVGVVLAGGVGRRFGGPKGSVRLGAETLAERAAAKLAPLCESVLVSIAPGAANPAPRRKPVEDARPAGRGPLAGIEAAYRATDRADLLVLACDYPWVEAALLERLASEEQDSDVVLVIDAHGRDHPLVALWRRRAERALGQALRSKEYAVQALLSRLEVRRLHATDFPDLDLARQLTNVNRPENLPSTTTPSRDETT